MPPVHLPGHRHCVVLTVKASAVAVAAMRALSHSPWAAAALLTLLTVALGACYDFRAVAPDGKFTLQWSKPSPSSEQITFSMSAPTERSTPYFGT